MAFLENINNLVWKKMKKKNPLLTGKLELLLLMFSVKIHPLVFLIPFFSL